jgi:hypothetical protein
MEGLARASSGCGSWYSSTAGRASPLKAYYVERNRLFLIVKNFPQESVVRLVSVVRYGWHVVFCRGGRGAAHTFVRTTTED